VCCAPAQLSAASSPAHLALHSKHAMLDTGSWNPRLVKYAVPSIVFGVVIATSITIATMMLLSDPSDIQGFRQ
jgi:hypothetical protein